MLLADHFQTFRADNFVIDYQPADEYAEAWFFVFAAGKIFHLIDELSESGWRPLTQVKFQQIFPDSLTKIYLGSYTTKNNKTIPCFAVSVQESDSSHLAEHYTAVRPLLTELEEQWLAPLSRAMQLVTWFEDHQFCGKCGQSNLMHQHETAMLCEDCNKTFYPRISPCIIVLVTKGEKILLAKGKQYKNGYYSTLAGFIEAGESAEQAVHREVYEEVGIRVKNLQYLTSQSWPFPHQLMLGYHAEWSTGEIDICEQEIHDAQWFDINQLPKRPSKGSISSWLIDEYLKQSK